MYLYIYTCIYGYMCIVLSVRECIHFQTGVADPVHTFTNVYTLHMHINRYNQAKYMCV